MKTGKPRNRMAPTPRTNPSAPPLIQQALQLHQSGQLQEAEKLYRQLLQQQPNNQDALNLLGFLFHQSGKRELAVEYINKAIAMDPGQPLFYNNLGIVIQNQGKHQEAIACYQKALAINPAYHAAYSNMGTVMQAQGKFDEAMACHQKALELEPDFFEAYANIGNVLCDQGKLDESLVWYDKALAIQPKYINALHNIGYVLQKMGKLDEAIRVLQRALEIKPDYLEALNSMGNVLQDQGNFSEAIVYYKKALGFNPRYYEAYCNMGNVLCDQGRLDESIAAHQQALAIKSDLHESYTHMANALQLQGRLDEAIACYQQALSIKPFDETALENLGVAYNVSGNLAGAIECNRQLLRDKMDNPNTHASLINLLKQICDWREFSTLFERMMVLFRTDTKIINPFVFLTLPTTADEQKVCAERYIQKKYRVSHTLAGQHRHDPNPARIKIGYLSCDFLNHATAILMAELIQLHDRDRFEIVMYSYSDNDGRELRQRIMDSSDRFVDILTVDHATAARKILEDGVHILVELKGFTKGARLEIAALRPAPIQVSWLGYPGTMGAAHIDYIIADPFIIPHGFESHYTEKVVRLPHCYQPNDRKRAYPERVPTRQECGLPEGGLIFSNFNQTYKITPELFDVWMDLLRRIPDSCLWLLESNALVADNLRREAEARGVQAARLIFAPKLPVSEHLARYHLVDLVLDTYPVTSHTTASDALWVGCPLLTLVGETFVSRVAGSLLHTVGLDELITGSLDEYAARALALAQDPERLRVMRAGLQANRLTMPLFDTPRFTRHLEAAYESIWQRHRSGLAPEHMDIASDASQTATLMHNPPLPVEVSQTATLIHKPPLPVDRTFAMPNATVAPSILLSICIPTRNHQEQLARTLDHLQWTQKAGIPIEIIVSDDASEDDTRRVAQEQGGKLSHFRYIRHSRSVGSVKNGISVMRQARGQFMVSLADDDRLLPEALLAEIDYLRQNNDIVANHAPWLLWNDVTRTELGLFYQLDEPVVFDKSQSPDMFNFIISRHIFPEIAIYRTASYMKVLFECHDIFAPLLMDFRVLHHGRIRFQPRPFYLSVVASSGQTDTHEKANGVHLINQLDRYRAGLEMAASLAMSNIGMTDFDAGNRLVVLDMINDFLIKRTMVAAHLALAQGNYSASAVCLKRALLWSKSDPEKELIRSLETTVLTGATYQAVKEVFNSTIGVKHLVLCELSNPEVVLGSFKQIAPEISVVSRDVSTALQAPDRGECLYLIETEQVRQAIEAAGIEVGKVILIADLLHMFRVTG
ncbi:MAG: tetratricopeptide repeat protein [Magnetococcus sp. YQC-5]